MSDTTGTLASERTKSSSLGSPQQSGGSVLKGQSLTMAYAQSQGLHNLKTGQIRAQTNGIISSNGQNYVMFGSTLSKIDSHYRPMK